MYSQQRYLKFVVHRRTSKAFVLVLISCVATACSLKKETGGQSYDMMENLTARYNIVYHGRKIINDVERENFASHRDNYHQLLPVLVEPTEASVSSNGVLMDSVIGKALNIINHKTRSRYMNEAYLLTGKANYLKGNYYNAVEFFSYVADVFRDMPEYRQAALVWKARSLMRLGNLTEAGLVLDTAFAGLDSEKRSVGMAFAVQAAYYLQIHDEESAITMLEQALDHTSHKATKLRWHFLLGQLLQGQGRSAEAHKHYNRVVRSNAPYEMSFHAGLNRVFLITDGSTSTAERVRLLRRMLRDGKNADFKDQIYHQIAEVFYADSNLAEALVNYEKALRVSGENRYQMTSTYLALADHYFSKADYPTAKLYYDSVGMMLPADFPDAGSIQRKVANLDGLIEQFQVIARQDTLQYLAGLDDGRRRAVLDTMASLAYARLQLPEATSKRSATARATGRQPFDDLPGTVETYTDGRFYFNNPDAMGLGQAEFRRRWGNRELRDNWRLSDLPTEAQTDATNPSLVDEQASAVTDTVTVDSAAWVSQYQESFLRELPDTEEKRVSSDKQIHDALLRVAAIYRDDLRDEREAARTFERLLERFPRTNEAALVYYNLFRLYTDKNEERANEYRARLLSEFPQSVYSRIVEDPMYLTKLEQEKQVLDQAYERVYTQYVNQQYAEVIGGVNRILGQQQGREQIRSQLAYLRALAVGRVDSLDAFEYALRELTETFPEDSLVTPLARQHLAFIDSHRDTLAGRVFALQEVDSGRERFVDEPALTPWPQLVIHPGPERPTSRKELAVGQVAQTGIRNGHELSNPTAIAPRQVAKTAEVGPVEANSYRDLELLPDSAAYYFVINVTSTRVNLAPSRFGIGQFNRSRYTGTALSHQLKVVNDENQMVYIGPFSSYEQVKQYESRILPMLPDIMKIPADYYNTFVITEANFGTLSDFDKIDDYHTIYWEQVSR